MALPPKLPVCAFPHADRSAKPVNAPTTLTNEEFNEKIKNLKNVDDVHNFLRDLVAPTLQTMLDAELDHHLGYTKYHPSGRGIDNSRNGHYPKTLKTRDGHVTLGIPRDRAGTFTPHTVPKYETCRPASRNASSRCTPRA